jgi:hypothetical protein
MRRSSGKFSPLAAVVCTKEQPRVYPASLSQRHRFATSAGRRARRRKPAERFSRACGPRMDDRGAAAPYSVREDRQPTALEISSARCRGHLNIALIMRHRSRRTVATPAATFELIGTSAPAMRLRIISSALCLSARPSPLPGGWGGFFSARWFRRPLKWNAQPGA